MTDLTLSPEQTRAVASHSKAIVVVAGAGTGKTELLAHRIERILRESKDEGFRVVAVSYTVKAADELRERLGLRLGDLHKRVDADTIHGFALTLLRQYGSRIGLPIEPEVLSRDEDRVVLLDAWLQQSGQDWGGDPLEVLAAIDLARAQCTAATLLDEWRAALDAAGALDYAAMLERGAELAEGAWVARHLARVYDHVVVDEAQNLTQAQYRFLTRIVGDPSSDHLNCMLVGDERQSIVGFAGADAGLIARFSSEYRAERIELHTNFRSARAIAAVGLEVAAALGRPGLGLNATNYSAEGQVQLEANATEIEEGRLVASWVSGLLQKGLGEALVSPGESRFVSAEQVAVLARSAASLRFTRDALNELEIDTSMASTPEDWVTSLPGQVVIELIGHRAAPGHTSIRRRLGRLCGNPGLDWTEVSALLFGAPDPDLKVLGEAVASARTPADLVELIAIAQLADLNWEDDIAQLQAAWASFVDVARVGERTFANFRQHISRCQRGDSMGSGVRLLTVHKAQGREFKAVAVIACNNGQFPDFRATGDEAQAAELRTFYVAVTRPSRCLLLTRARQRSTRFGARPTEPSPFLRWVNQAEQARLLAQ
ncbi:MAG TPA: ATP-dependent helicase [Actinomycetota bacterium]|nr:ATP-dependent helicase [Actinomycetota bacterium]